ncbi:MAG: patatin-like phospholipase family protein [Pseudorhodoplanes sp.]|nr:patatin-like phospholipase family protein [Pseudorhodoplanes sp.]
MGTGEGRVLHRLLRNGNDDRAADASSERPVPPRPSIGLALGGGAARGFAHVGVLRVLEENGIVPDVIVGTSIGAVAGGCYAYNQLDAFEEWARGLNARGVLGYLDVSLGGSGLIRGDRLAKRLEVALGDVTIENLPRHFAAIATELGTGHEIWLTRGRLIHALRASYALPGIFNPIRVGGRWLVDGALVNPVPVSAARALGARLVIAVNLNADLLGHGVTISSHGSDESDALELQSMRERSSGLRNLFNLENLLKRQFIGTAGRPNIAHVMIDAFNIIQDRVTRARLAGDPPDVMISPRLGKVGLFDFHRAKEAIAIGDQAARKAVPDILEALSVLT